MGFSSFSLHHDVLRGVQAAGYQTPTAIQSLAIPPVLAGQDLIGCAQTGTGKTGAFMLPLLHHLSAAARTRSGNAYPRALVLTPTRELAQQVHDAAGLLGQFLSLRTTCLYGGANMDKQLAQLRRGVDIVVATPGRLLDHLQRGALDLSRIEVLVLDEADRMLDMGFIHDVTKIIERTPRKRQTLLFSATLSEEVARLASRFLRDPRVVDAGGHHNPVGTIIQRFYSAPRETKMDLLLHALQTEPMKSVLVFSRTKHGADKISRRLERSGISAGVIHSNRSQPQRERALDAFKQGRMRVLVATDIAARGIDVSGISHVVNYDVPQAAEDYVHRIGRTGRAGASGHALTMVGNEEREYIRRIERFTGMQIVLERLPNMTPTQRPEGRDARVHSSQPAREASGSRQPRMSERGERSPKKRRSPEQFTARKRRFTPASRTEAWSNHGEV